MRFDKYEISDATRRTVDRLPPKIAERMARRDRDAWPSPRVQYYIHVDDWLDANLPRIRKEYAMSAEGQAATSQKQAEAQHDAMRRAAKGHEVKSATMTRWVLEQLGVTWQQLASGGITYFMPDGTSATFENENRRDGRGLKPDLAPYLVYATDEDEGKHYHEFIKRAAAEKAGLKLSDDSERPPRDRNYLTDFTIRTCQICFRDIKATTGVMADHGFHIVGRDQNYQGGVRRAHCEGTGELPFEISCELTIALLDASIEDAQAMETELRRLRESPPDSLVTEKYNYSTREREYVTVARGTHDYNLELQDEIRALSAKLRAAWSGLFQSIPWLRMAVRTWAPGNPNAPAVGAPDAPLIDSDWVGLPAGVERRRRGMR